MSKNIILFCEAQEKYPKRNYILAQIESYFTEATEKLRFYTAARYAIAKLLREAEQINGQKGTPFLNSTWLGRSGEIPIDFSENYALQQGGQHLSQFQTKASFFTPNQFEMYFEEYKIIFDNHFCNDYQNALKWYNGKDLQTFIQQQIGIHIAFNGKHGFYKYVFDENLFNYKNHTDFVQLYNFIEAL